MDRIQEGKSVYILKTTKKLYKIGKTENLTERIGAYRTHLPTLFSIVRQYMAENMNELEQSLHVVFQHKRVQGEWFKLKKEDLTICDNIARNYALEKLQKQKKSYKIEFHTSPILQVQEANVKYLSDYEPVVKDIELGLTTNEIIEINEGNISKTTIQTLRQILKTHTPNAEFITRWKFVAEDLAEGLTVQEIITKYEGKVSKTTVQTIRRILRNQLY